MYENFIEGSEGGRNIKHIEQRKKSTVVLILHNKLQINHILFITSYN